MVVDYGIDLGEVRRVIDAAGVLVVRFSVTDQRLLIDARTNDDFGPLIKVVPRAGSAEERFKSVKILRPRFRVPERILTFHWPRHARALKESGVWDYTAKRLVSLGRPETAAQCDETYGELLQHELNAERAAIRGGEGFHTKWAADGHTDE